MTNNFNYITYETEINVSRGQTSKARFFNVMLTFIIDKSIFMSRHFSILRNI